MIVTQQAERSSVPLYVLLSNAESLRLWSWTTRSIDTRSATGTRTVSVPDESLFIRRTKDVLHSANLAISIVSNEPVLIQDLTRSDLLSMTAVDYLQVIANAREIHLQETGVLAYDLRTVTGSGSPSGVRG